ncbi:MAG: aminoacyl-tRNA hydrolase [Cytophagaceae bacterium]|jgi:ribosome-associated protein|nr:aminoacyl-tRNA hydrolase [Cytophagaceae bacterium]
METPLRNRDLYRELRYSATRSSGAGGQHVNKVSSRVELRFSIANSQALTDDEKSLIAQKLATRINQAGELVLAAQTERSQYRNKLIVTERFFNLLENALVQHEERIPTHPSKATIAKRMNDKIRLSQKKQNRNNGKHLYDI